MVSLFILQNLNDLLKRQFYVLRKFEQTKSQFTKHWLQLWLSYRKLIMLIRFLR